MFNTLWKALHSALENSLVSGGLVLMVTGAIMGLARKVPGQCGRWVKRRITFQVEVLNSDPLFECLTYWLNNQPYTQRSRRLTASTRNDSGNSDVPAQMNAAAPKLQVLFSPAPGLHLFFYRRNLIALDRLREGSESPTSSGGATSLRKHEKYTITVIGKRQELIRDLIGEIVEYATESHEGVKLLRSSFGYWESNGYAHARPLSSVVLPRGLAESVLSDCRKFLNSSEWYRTVGIPWHRGYLLHGLPGTGKSSLVMALAGELRMDLYCLNVSARGMDDERLDSLMSQVRARTIVLMEDVDCTFPSRDTHAEGTKGVTLSGLLNSLDGVGSREGCLVFMTTNFAERLDAALVRPGRVDVNVEFGYALPEQIVQLRDRIAPGRDITSLLEIPRTMAEVQSALLQ